MKKYGFILWLTGLSGAGKTTLTQGLECELRKRGCLIEILDGDVVRTNLSHGLGYSQEDRNTNIRRIGFVANLLSRNGIGVIVAAISPYREVRDELRETTNNFIEVYVNAPLAVCEMRDVKGLYAKARSGEIKGLTGIDDPYEVPKSSEIVINTAKEPTKKSLEKIIDYLRKKKLI